MLSETTHFALYVRSFGHFNEMLEKLNTRFDWKMSASKVSILIELVSVLYKSHYANSLKHVGRVDRLFEQLTTISVPFPDTLAIEIFVVLLDAP